MKRNEFIELRMDIMEILRDANADLNVVMLISERLEEYKRAVNAQLNQVLLEVQKLM